MSSLAWLGVKILMMSITKVFIAAVRQAVLVSPQYNNVVSFRQCVCLLSPPCIKVVSFVLRCETKPCDTTDLTHAQHAQYASCAKWIQPLKRIPPPSRARATVPLHPTRLPTAIRVRARVTQLCTSYVLLLGCPKRRSYIHVCDDSC